MGMTGSGPWANKPVQDPQFDSDLYDIEQIALNGRTIGIGLKPYRRYTELLKNSPGYAARKYETFTTAQALIDSAQFIQVKGSQPQAIQLIVDSISGLIKTNKADILHSDSFGILILGLAARGYPQQATDLLYPVIQSNQNIPKQEHSIASHPVLLKAISFLMNEDVQPKASHLLFRLRSQDEKGLAKNYTLGSLLSAAQSVEDQLDILELFNSMSIRNIDIFAQNTSVRDALDELVHSSQNREVINIIEMIQNNLRFIRPPGQSRDY